MVSDILIIGTGGQAHDVYAIINSINSQDKIWNIRGFIDDNIENHDKIFSDLPTTGNPDWLINNHDISNLNVAIGDCKIRQKIIEKISTDIHYQFPNLIHQKSVVTNEVKLKNGISIHAGVLFGSNSQVGHHSILLYGSTIGHDTIIGNFVTICPGVHVNGSVTIGDGTYIGSGTVINQGITIGSGCIIGSGSVVMDDIPDNVVATGYRARPVKKND